MVSMPLCSLYVSLSWLLSLSVTSFVSVSFCLPHSSPLSLVLSLFFFVRKRARRCLSVCMTLVLHAAVPMAYHASLACIGRLSPLRLRYSDQLLTTHECRRFTHGASTVLGSWDGSLASTTSNAAQLTSKASWRCRLGRESRLPTQKFSCIPRSQFIGRMARRISSGP